MSKIYIEDFCENLNYQGIILYIGEEIDLDKLYEKLCSDHINHMYRYEAVRDNRLFYVENCDLQDINDLDELFELLDDEQTCVLRLNKDADGYYLNIPSIIEHCILHGSISKQKREDILKEMQELSKVSAGDPETAHLQMDGILCDILKELSFSDIVKEFQKATRYYC